MLDIVAIRTIVPILFLLGLGFLSRKIDVLKSGDERVFSAYVYYFALPALFIADLAEISFTPENLHFVFVGLIPIFLVLTLYIICYFVFKFSRNILYLLIVSTFFGSLTFFGIPFVMLAFPEAVKLATLSAASISVIAVPLSITALELYQLEQSTFLITVKRVFKKFSKNPLIISILLGIVLSFFGVKIPPLITTSLRMLGNTTAAVAIFMLGVFLYGRKYTNIGVAFKLSLLRIVLLPAVAMITSIIFNVAMMERAIILVMHGVPVAISNIILSERYNFYKETIASLILISSVAAGLYLNLWLLLLGY
jgi:predicted permease